MAAIVQISRVQHRTGLFRELPVALNEAELGWALDTRQLFIGNGPIHPGNTEIITAQTPASSLNYSYRSPIAYQQLLSSGALTENEPVTANTGFIASTGGPGLNDLVPSSLNPTIRSYQEKFDEIVSVKDYGANGDFNTDDTGALYRAIMDTFAEQHGDVNPDDPNAAKRNVAIFLPAGVYRTRAQLPLVPGLRLIGEPGRSIIYLDTELTTADDDNDGVFISADSLGQVYPEMGTNVGDGEPEIQSPEDIFIRGVTMRSNHDRFAPVSKRQVVRLSSANHIRFERCGFEFVAKDGDPTFDPTSPWTPGDAQANAQSAVLITKLNNTTITDQQAVIEFIGCTFNGGAHDINIIDGAVNVSADRCHFSGLLTPVKVGYDSSVDTDSTYRNPAGTARISNVTVSNSVFNEGYTDYALKVMDGATFVHSFSNTYKNTVGYSIYFHSTAVNGSSISDMFDNFDSVECGIPNPRVNNLSTTTTIMNAQDFKVFPIGLSDTTICGNLTVIGNLLVVPVLSCEQLITTVAYPNAYVAQPNPFKGNSVRMDYAMKIPNSGNPIFRTGTLKIIYTESAQAVGGAMQFSDDFVEVGGAGTNVSLAVAFDNVAQNIRITTVSDMGTPQVKFTISAVDILNNDCGPSEPELEIPM